MDTGRPTKLTPEIQTAICTAIQSGCYIETAAVYAGIGKATLYRWLKKGASRDSGKYRRFKIEVERAIARAEIRDLLMIQKAAEVHWQASAWRLERRHPTRWSKRTRDEAKTAERERTPEEFAAEIRKSIAEARATVPGPPPPITPPASEAGSTDAGHDSPKEPTA